MRDSCPAKIPEQLVFVCVLGDGGLGHPRAETWEWQECAKFVNKISAGGLELGKAKLGKQYGRAGESFASPCMNNVRGPISLHWRYLRHSRFQDWSHGPTVAKLFPSPVVDLGDTDGGEMIMQVDFLESRFS